MATLVCFLEERSAKAMLNIILPKLLPPGISFQCIAFEGKADLRKNFAKKLKGYRAPDSVFLIMCDQDAMKCRELKQELQRKIPQGKKAKVRIACRELESFYLGDLEAVEQGLNVPGVAKHQGKKKFRQPDNSIRKPSKELENITRGKYQKIPGAKAIAPHLKLDDSNLSNSFRVLVHGIRNAVPAAKPCAAKEL